MTEENQLQPENAWTELEAVIKAIADRFQIGRLQTVAVLSALEAEEALSPDVFVLTSLFKGAQADWVLKRHRSGKSWERLAVEQELAFGLAQVGYDLIPQAVPTRGGKTYVEEAGQLWSVYPRLLGVPLPMFGRQYWNEARASDLGCQLARLHIAGFGVTEHIAHWRQLPDLSVKLSAAKVLTWFDRLCGSARDARLDNPDDQVLSFFAFASERPDRRLEEALVKVDRWQAEAPAVLVHGDLHPANLLFQDDRLTGILDLEFARLDSPLFDLGYLNFFLQGERNDALEPRTEGETTDSDRDSGKEALMARLVASYLGQWPDNRVMASLGRAQIEERLPAYTLLAGLLSTCWFLERYLSARMYPTRLRSSAAFLKYLFHCG